MRRVWSTEYGVRRVERATLRAPSRTIFAPYSVLRPSYFFFFFAALFFPTFCLAQKPVERGDKTTPSLMQPATQEAIKRGLDFLAKAQNEDGSFGDRQLGRNVGVCSLVGMAFMSNGSMPGRGPYAKQVSRCTDFVLQSCQESGFITVTGATSHGPMYEHGFATLLLAETYGMSQNPKFRDKLVAAVKLIVDKQNNEGGWRYQPERRDADISVTICQVMALRAARNAGIYVPNETIDRCVDYVKRSQNPDGGFSYMLAARGSSLFPRSAAGVVALYSAGIYEGEEIQRGLNYLMQHIPAKVPRADDGHYFYGQYYAAQAMWHAGGDYWKKWYPAIHDELTPRQRPNGSWLDQISPEYGTAMACLVLQMPNSYLPIFQK